MKNIAIYKLMGMVSTIPIPPASARATSKERLIDRVKPSGDRFVIYKISIGIEPLT